MSKDVKAHQKAQEKKKQEAREAAEAEAERKRQTVQKPVPSSGGSGAEATPAKPSGPKPATKPTSKPEPQAAPSASAITGQMLSQINNTRQNAGLSKLSVSSCAEGAAKTWAAELAKRETLVHQSLGPVMSSCGARGAAENIAMGYSNGGVFNGWMSSPGHKKNILRSSATSVGVAVANSANGTSHHVTVCSMKRCLPRHIGRT